jgi:hypothetical protein
MDEFGFKRELHGISDPWHKIEFPDDIFAKVNNDLSDIRIYGITEINDTIEAPYLLEIATDNKEEVDVSFKLINQSSSKGGYYFTFEITVEKTINQIMLDFNEENFDWRIKLEGSQDQHQWFGILKNYRILSIKNKQTDYHFTKLTFSNSKYRFFRIFINSPKKPGLKSAKLRFCEIKEGNYRDYMLSVIRIAEDKQNKETAIYAKLNMPVPISVLKININNTIDYYRPFTIEYLVDSFKTEMGWKYNYRKLTSGILNSIEKNEFRFNSRITQNIKITIYNYDNEAITIGDIEAKAATHQLIARFSKQAVYYLVYSKPFATAPQYDIDHFTVNIPDNLIILQIGNEKSISKNNPPGTGPLFKNKTWLWAVMAIIILLLAWFSVNMIRKK